LFASLAKSVIGVALMIATGAGRRLALPFAPFLCTGALLYLFFGQIFMFFYFG
jgi:leader peptidase (prepilin peptidase) / N-methyltransferase